MITLYILKKSEYIRTKWQKKFQYIMVDEFQDVNKSQFELASVLSQYYKNLFVVGDPDQTIYSWRGANVNFILNFDKVFPNAETIVMNINYRSTSTIIKAANQLISHNANRFDKDIIAINKTPVKIEYANLKNIWDEAKWISKQIQHLIDEGASYDDIAILYRSHFASRGLEEIFLQYNIPYIVYSGVAFYQRKEIKDILSYLKMLVCDDDLSFLRTVNTPKRGIGDKKLSILKEYADKHNCSLYEALKYNISSPFMNKCRASEYISLIENYRKLINKYSVSELTTMILNDSGYESMLRNSGDEDRLDNLAELKQSIAEYEERSENDINLTDYLNEIALYTNADKNDNSEKIKMMTIHNAKGLEFPYVFICRFNEDIFPSRKANFIWDLEEERRLCYVAYTRAKNKLFLSSVRSISGNITVPSRFLVNSGLENINCENIIDTEYINTLNDLKNTASINDKPLYKVGDTVHHEVFGTGTIISTDDKNSYYCVKFERFPTERNIASDALFNCSGSD